MTNLAFAPPDTGAVLLLTGLPGGSDKIYDRSPYGNAGTITGATWTRLPSGVWALDFDGVDDYVDCGNNLSLDLSAGGAGTFLAWIYADDPGNGYDIIFCKRPGSNPATFDFYIQDASARLSWWISGAEKPSSYVVAASTWLFAGFVVGPNLEFFVNGASVGTVASTMGSANSAVVRLGASEIAGERFDGKIALPRIYNRMLSALEIQNLYNREKHLFGVW